MASSPWLTPTAGSERPRWHYAVAFAVMLVIVLGFLSLMAEARHERCQSGEDEAIEQEFEDGSRTNCNDLRPPWRRL
jgi:hypothetical protein